MTRYGLYGVRSRAFLTLGGLILTHDNAAELEWLVVGAKVRAVPESIPDTQTLSITRHPDLVGVRWPLRRGDFRG